MGVDERQQGTHLAGHITYKSHYENITDKIGWAILKIVYVIFLC